MADLPTGIVTFMFSDIEESTRLLDRAPDQAGEALARHHDIMGAAVDENHGVVFETVGDAVYAAFALPTNAIATALAMQRALSAEDWGSVGRLAVRIAIHTGEVEQRGNHYFGAALFRTARIQSLGWGEQILVSDVTARLAGALPDGVRLRDLGLHRLKDLGEPERVHQLVHHDLRDAFPPLKSLDPQRHNLPIVASRFIGRDAEVREVTAFLASHRLVTLTGPGGCGKTRLALQVAAEAIPAFADGVTFVDLASVRDAVLVMPAIGSALGLPQRPDEPMETTVARYLADRGLLLVLDNLEQVRPDPGADIETLLEAAPGVRVLATSRGSLRLRGEQEYPVGRLEAAASLFHERASEVRPDIAAGDLDASLVEEVCATLDGLPLAIELAAARMRMFDLPALRDRLIASGGGRLGLLTGAGPDAPMRHRTMSETIAWSVDLLSDEQRTAFGQLSVFAGAFEPAAGEAAIGGVGDDPLGILDGLVHHALLAPVQHAHGRRLRMLEPIREYAEALLASGEEDRAARAAHARWVAGMTEEAATDYRTPRHGVALDRIASYIDDVRAALGWAFNGGDAAIGVRIAMAMGRYWDERDTTNGLVWLERATNVSTLDPATRMQLVRRLGWIHARRGERTAARSDFEELMRLGRLLEEPESLASGLSNLAYVALVEGRLADARRHLDELAEEVNIEEPWASAITERMRGRLEAEDGNLDASVRHFGRSEQIARGSGAWSTLSGTLHDRGVAAMWNGDLEAASRHLSEAERLAREVGFKGVLAPALTHLAVLAARYGSIESARASAGEAVQEFEALGGAEWLEALFDVAAWIAVESDQIEAAASLAGAAAARWDEIDRGVRASDRAWHARLVDRVRDAAGASWDDAYSRGRAMSIPDALRLARSTADG